MSVFEVLISFGQFRRGQVHAVHEPTGLGAWVALAAAGYVRELGVVPDAAAVIDHVLVGLDDPGPRVRVRRTAKKAEVTDGQDSPESGDGTPDRQE